MNLNNIKEEIKNQQLNIKNQFEGYPSWYAQQLASKQPINISKFKGNLQDAAIFYSKEVNKLFFANTVLHTQLKQAIQEKKQLADLIINLQRTQKNSNEERKKRHRRCASEIQRKFICAVQKCCKSYGSQGSLAQHMRLKHPDVEYIPDKIDENQLKIQEKQQEEEQLEQQQQQQLNQ